MEIMDKKLLYFQWQRPRTHTRPGPHWGPPADPVKPCPH